MSRQLRLIAHEQIAELPHRTALPTPAYSLDEFRALGFRQCHWVVDVSQMTVSHIGRDFEAIFQIPSQVMHADPAGFLVRVHPEDRPTLMVHLSTCLERGIDIELRLVYGKDQKCVWLRSFPLENEDLFLGTRMLFVVEDITSTKRREQKQG